MALATTDRRSATSRWKAQLLSPVSIDIPLVLDRLCYRYPSLLVDALVQHEPGRRLVAVKNVTVNEEFFQGHFPGAPLMPGVLMIEALVQVATILLLHRDGGQPTARVSLRRVTNAKFRRQVVPGDRLRLEVTLAQSASVGRPSGGGRLRRRSAGRGSRVTHGARAGRHPD